MVIVLVVLVLLQLPYNHANKIENEERGLVGHQGCPVEHYQGIRPKGVTINKREYHNSTNRLDLECHNPNETFVYPTSRRVCQSNGQWSGVPPICLLRDNSTVYRRPSNPYLKHNASIRYCSADGSCSDAARRWYPVGRLHESCATKREENSIDDDHHVHRQVLCEFERPVHLSFLTFILPNNGNDTLSRRFHFEVKVPPEGMIWELSSTSVNYLKNDYCHFVEKEKHHHQKVVGDNNNKVHQCAVVELAAYTKRLLVSFSSRKKNTNDRINLEWRPRPTFYTLSHEELHFVEEAPAAASADRMNHLQEETNSSSYPTIAMFNSSHDDGIERHVKDTKKNETSPAVNQYDNGLYTATGLLLVLGVVCGSLAALLCIRGNNGALCTKHPTIGKSHVMITDRYLKRLKTARPPFTYTSHRGVKHKEKHQSPVLTKFTDMEVSAPSKSEHDYEYVV